MNKQSGRGTGSGSNIIYLFFTFFLRTDILKTLFCPKLLVSLHRERFSNLLVADVLYTHVDAALLNCCSLEHCANIYIHTYIAQGEHGLLLLISLWRQNTVRVSKYLNCKRILKQFRLFKCCNCTYGTRCLVCLILYVQLKHTR